MYLILLRMMNTLNKKCPAPFGAIFTPLNIAMETINETGLFEKWLKGAIVFDPTAGSGNFIEAFVKQAIIQNIEITDKLLKNLYAMELQEVFVKEFHQKMKDIYGIIFPKENFIHGDFLFTPFPIKADYLLGNPPWLNFSDLEDQYKEDIKHFFLESPLANNKKDLLLGGARIDISALIVCEAMKRNLKEEGKAFFFLPLSLFLNDGAHNGFRSALTKEEKISLDYIYDYKGYSIFPTVSTRYGFACFTKKSRTNFPINYFLKKDSKKWIKNYASPIGECGSPYVMHKKDKILKLPQIPIKKENKPRQGLNTCGANRLFIFNEMEPLDQRLCKLKNSSNEAILPIELVYPLICTAQFKEVSKKKFVFLPYNENGKVKSEMEVKQYTEAFEYLLEHKKYLMNRKGVLIQSSIKKGLWWSLLGVGPYSFFPWKIVWEAFGKKEFQVKLFSTEKGKIWQPNQALQAFIPLKDEKSANKILNELKNPLIEKILKSQGMEGTCNWAQPGRMMKFFTIIDKD